MSAVRVAKTVLLVVFAASRNPAVRAAIKSAPNLMTEAQKAKAIETTKRAAYGAGVLASRVLARHKTGA